MNKMKTICLFLLGVLAVSVHAQNADKKVRIKVKDNDNGKVIQIDTAFELNGSDDIESVLRSLGLDSEIELNGADEEVEIMIRRKKVGSDDNQMHIRLFEEGAMEDHLLELGEQSNKAFLGIYYDATVEKTIERFGDEEVVTETHTGEGEIRVTSVIDGSGAARGGIMTDDIIKGINGQLFSDGYSIHDILDAHSPGDVVTVNLERAGSEMDLGVTLGTRKTGMSKYHMDEDGSFEFHFDEEDLNLDQLRFQFDEEHSHTPFLGVYIGEPVNGGIQIDGTVEGSTAEQMNLREGDIVTAINGIPTPDFNALKEAIGSTTIGENVSVNYVREGDSFVAISEMQSHADGDHIVMKKGLNHCFSNIEGLIQDEIILNGEALSDELIEDLQELRNLEDLNIFFGEGEEGFEIEIEDVLGNDFNWEENDGQVIRQIAIFITMDDVSEEEADQINASSDERISTNNDLPIEAVYFAPNPNDGRFTLNFSLVESGSVALRILDITGKEVYRDELSGEPGSYSQVIDISSEPKGTYFMQVMQNGKQFSKKIVIQ